MPDWLAPWISVAGFVNIVLVVLLAEAIVLIARGSTAKSVLVALGPAVLIMGAWRAALVPLPIGVISLLLGGAFVFHLWDLRTRPLP